VKLPRMLWAADTRRYTASPLPQGYTFLQSLKSMNCQSSRLLFVCVALIMLAMTGCKSHAAQESEIDIGEIQQTVLQLENHLHLGVDSLRCGLPDVGEGQPTFVSNGFVIRTGDELREMCEELVAPRTGAVWVVDTISANVLSRDIAYVVREGNYTISFKDRDPQSVDAVITTIWHRQDEEWKMVHLHESSLEPF